LMDNNRRRIELLNSLLLSFPGTPIVYYGDEIGMGDNIYLGDRNGVRTPMQWSGDRNAGFSRANPAKLYSPVIMDPVWGYEAVNAEAQQSDPSSLLNWMRNMIALRKLFGVFGRGTLKFLEPQNRKVLAYLRQYEEEQVLCIANLSRFAQPVDLDLSELEGMVPVEMLGYVEFPPIGRQPYRLTLGAYGFLWLELHGTPESAEALVPEKAATLNAGAGWDSLFEGVAGQRLENTILPEYLPKQRWFSGKARKIHGTRIIDWACLAPHAVLALVEAQNGDGFPQTYAMPLAISPAEAVERWRESAPGAMLTPIATPEGSGVLHDAILDDAASAALLALVEMSGELQARHGVMRGVPGAALPSLRGDSPLASRPLLGEQSNSSIAYGDRLLLKLFRRYQPGPSPECEMERYLTQKGFEHIPAFAGLIEYRPKHGDRGVVAMLQAWVANEGDGWQSTIEELERYYENCAPLSFPEGGLGSGDLMQLSEEPLSQLAQDHVGIYLDSAAKLGRRTAELHRALAASSDDPAFDPEPISPEDVQALLAHLRDQASRTFETLRDNVSRLPDDVLELAGLTLGRRRQILDHFRAPISDAPQGVRMRIHGDYHLGQVLRVRADYVIVDFEGEPARSLAERRAKQSPLKDVAGMLRSFSYGAYATLISYTARRPEDFARLEPWARLWERSACAGFLRAYREAAQGADFLPAAREDFRRLLSAFWLDKALYEFSYELNNRTAWLRIPLMGILSLPL
ncbi:MAG TPA: putative maltokinase, partial [Bryobacteraceae bacterium]|nr:putative maltokinase [Bryobacteraceae bacterium]